MNLLILISSGADETIHNGMGLANVAHGQGDDVSVFMLCHKG